jgi:hypothetical protein
MEREWRGKKGERVICNVELWVSIGMKFNANEKE